jgi:long-subunit acyl-CoA synthetase (AMP-forming)
MLVQEYFDVVHSLLMITTAFALISSYSTRFELVHALKLTKVTRLFVDAKLLKNVLAAIDDPAVQVTPDRIYILTGQPVGGRESFGQMVDAVQRNKVAPEPVREAQRDTLAYLVMSSGTSGLPKGASESIIRSATQ